MRHGGAVPVPFSGRIGRYHLLPPLLVLGGLQHIAGLGVKKMNSPAIGTRHWFVNFAICFVIGSNPALHLQTSSWATVDEGNNHVPAIWEAAPLDALLISANVLFACATFAR